jgi:hypothetical protein
VDRPASVPRACDLGAGDFHVDELDSGSEAAMSTWDRRERLAEGLAALLVAVAVFFAVRLLAVWWLR